MRYSIQTNKITGKDWLRYHPYSNATFIDNYYVELCNKVLKIIHQSEIVDFLFNQKEEKALACILVAYFEDVISETRLFSTFTRLHKKMYGKELPFYEISDDYCGDDINLHDIFFLIWYLMSINDLDEMILDPYFENSQKFYEAASEIYNLFDREFEKAPQNENLQNFLQLSSDSDIKTVREKLSFIAQDSFLWNPFFSDCLDEILDYYKEKGKIVLNERNNMQIYDQKIHFIFNECMPLLTLRATEYFAEILGENHSKYQFIKNISKRIFGSFLILKIESNGYLLEHLSSKKQLWLSNEFTTIDNDKIFENKSVVSLGLVQWENDVWQNQGICIIDNIRNMNEPENTKHIFDDENMKMEFTHKLEKAFLEITNGESIVYLSGSSEYATFNLEVAMKHAKITDPTVTDEKLNKIYEHFVEGTEQNLPFEKEDPVGVFFNPNSGMEIYMDNVISCMPNKNNPYYTNEKFDLSDLITITTFSKEFVNYIIDNKLINLCVYDYENPDMHSIIMDNLDFLLRFYRRGQYFSKPEVTIKLK